MNEPFERAAIREELARRSRRRSRRARGQRTGFRIHLVVFVGVQLLLVAVWLLQWRLGGTAYPWFVYPLLGWGVGLAAHYAAIRGSLAEEPDRERLDG